jgi:hypothetical protein
VGQRKGDGEGTTCLFWRRGKTLDDPQGFGMEARFSRASIDVLRIPSSVHEGIPPHHRLLAGQLTSEWLEGVGLARTG